MTESLSQRLSTVLPQVSRGGWWGWGVCVANMLPGHADIAAMSGLQPRLLAQHHAVTSLPGVYFTKEEVPFR